MSVVTVSLSGFIQEMESRRQTVTVFAREPQFGFGSCFGPRHVSVEYERLPDDESDEFVSVSLGETYLGSVTLSSLKALDDAHDADATVGGQTQLAADELRDLYALLDETVFSSFDRRKMLATSREIEDRAARVENGTLYAGFQRLSALESQLEVYHSLGQFPALDVHVYGQPDWEPPHGTEFDVHAAVDEEIRDTWFVVYDGGGDDIHKCALLAEERYRGQFYGFWTYDPELVDRVVAYVDETFTDRPDGDEVHADQRNETP